MHTVLQRLAKLGEDRDEAYVLSVQSRVARLNPVLPRRAAHAPPARRVALHLPAASRLCPAEAQSPPVSLCKRRGSLRLS